LGAVGRSKTNLFRMPMKNRSTFIFFVKNFFARSESDFKSMNRSSENSLAGMEKTGVSPSKKSIQRILDFAHAYDVVETETAGQVEMNLN
jgi:5,10-methylenetetrahydrofolate reductase